MLALLIKKEIILNILSSRFIVTFVLFFGLLLVSVFVMTNDYKIAVERYSASVTAHREDLDELKRIEDVNEQMNDLLYNRGVYSDRRPKDLSIFSKGLEDHISVDAVHPDMLTDGWSFDDGWPGATGDTLMGKRFMREVYLAARPDATTRVTAPVLFGRMHVTSILGEFLDLYPAVTAER